MEASLVEHHTCVCFLAFSNINHRCLLSIFLSYGLIKQCANLRSTHFDVSKSEILIRILANEFIKKMHRATLAAEIRKMQEI